MSYRSLHREQLRADVAIYDVKALPGEGLFLTAQGDGTVRLYHAAESSVDADQLDASALTITEKQVLNGKEEGSIGISRVGWTRNYVGEDMDAGTIVIVSLDLAGRLRVWELPDLEKIETKNKALQEFSLSEATGTTLHIMRPTSKQECDLTIAVGCLDGTVAIVATGIAIEQQDKPASAPGTILQSLSSPGSAIPLDISPHPVFQNLWAVARQDGLVDIVSTERKGYRLSTTPEKAPARAVTWTNDGHLLTVATDSGWMGVWDVSASLSGTSTIPPALVHHVAGRDLVLRMEALDDRRWATASTDGQVRVWHVGYIGTEQAVHSFVSDHVVWGMALMKTPSSTSSSPQGLRLFTGSDTGWLQAYSLEASK